MEIKPMNIVSTVLTAVRKYSEHHANRGYPSILFLGPEERRELNKVIKDMPFMGGDVPDLSNPINDGCFNYQGMNVKYLVSDGCYAGHANSGYY